MYFADQKHLVKYGNSISQETYVAMPNGPVPSLAYDILKAIKKEGLAKSFYDVFTPYFEVKGILVKSKINADLDNLSQSEIQCLNESITENKDLWFEELTQKSHDSAWNSAWNSYNTSNIDLLKIAEAGGANNDMINYIETNLENQFAIFE